MDSIPMLLVTANVGSIFEAPDEMIHIWVNEFLSVVKKFDPRFIALHCQEVGGKNYELSMKHVEQFISLLSSSDELSFFDKSRVFLDEDYSSAEHFTALGNLYFIHKSMEFEHVMLWNFKEEKFVELDDREKVYSGNIESVETKEKAKFPQDFFPECKWSRKGFLRTRWNLKGTVFDLVNIHLFHDASNFLAMDTFPSVFSKNRRRALEHILEKFHNDPYDNVPAFYFGDFNFRVDTGGVVEKITQGLTTTRMQSSKNSDQLKVHFNDDNDQLILSIGKKEFHHSKHQDVFLSSDLSWLRNFDKELEPFKEYLSEYEITFPPSYPFEEKVSKGSNYMQTRCPAWCDRVLLSHSAKQLVDEKHKVQYGLMGLDTCMGDHKPVYLKLDVNCSKGIVRCCDHAPLQCLPYTCHCCRLFASVQINVVDMSETNSNKKSPSSLNSSRSMIIEIDSKLLHEPVITREMLSHEPYTPESAESHSPLLLEKKSYSNNNNNENNKVPVSPTLLTTKLECVLRSEVEPPKINILTDKLRLWQPPPPPQPPPPLTDLPFLICETTESDISNIDRMPDLSIDTRSAFQRKASLTVKNCLDNNYQEDPTYHRTSSNSSSFEVNIENFKKIVSLENENIVLKKKKRRKKAKTKQCCNVS